MRDPKAARDFEGGTFRLASVDEFPVSKTISGGLMIINEGKQRNLHWHVNANEWNYYLRGKGQMTLYAEPSRLFENNNKRRVQTEEQRALIKSAKTSERLGQLRHGRELRKHLAIPEREIAELKSAR